MIRLKEMRHISNMTQLEVSRAIGISRSYYSNIENGQRSLTSDRLALLAKLFNVSTEYLCGISSHASESFTEITSYDEHALILKYRQLNSIGKRVVSTTADIVSGNSYYADIQHNSI